MNQFREWKKFSLKKKCMHFLNRNHTVEKHITAKKVNIFNYLDKYLKKYGLKITKWSVLPFAKIISTILFAFSIGKIAIEKVNKVKWDFFEIKFL